MNIAVSACLLGKKCRFDGEARPSNAVQALLENHRVVPICPENAARLPIPRPPNEIVTAEDELRVVNSAGTDNTEAFIRGAQATLERIQAADCPLAVLKSKSPSCGSERIFDGTFTGTLTEGWGVAARMIRDAGIRVVDEKRIEALSAECGGAPDDNALRSLLAEG